MKMKRILAVALALAMGLSHVSCSQSTEREETQLQQTEQVEQPAKMPEEKPTEKPTEKTKVNLAALSGPTALGMLELLEQNEKGEAQTIIRSPLQPRRTRWLPRWCPVSWTSQRCRPTWQPPCHNKTQGGVQLAALNTMGVLYIVEAGESIQSVADLKGKTIYSTGQGSTPEYALNLVLEKNGLTVGEDVTVVYKTDNSEIAPAAGFRRSAGGAASTAVCDLGDGTERNAAGRTGYD